MRGIMRGTDPLWVRQNCLTIIFEEFSIYSELGVPFYTQG